MPIISRLCFVEPWWIILHGNQLSSHQNYHIAVSSSLGQVKESGEPLTWVEKDEIQWILIRWEAYGSWNVSLHKGLREPCEWRTWTQARRARWVCDGNPCWDCLWSSLAVHHKRDVWERRWKATRSRAHVYLHQFHWQQEHGMSSCPSAPFDSWK